MIGTSNAATPTGGGGAFGQDLDLRPDRAAHDAVAARAYLDDTAESRIRQNIKKLAPADWKSGDPKKDGNLRLIDIVALFGARPKGGPDAALKELREQLFPGKRFKMLQPAPSGQGVAVVEW